VKEDAAMAAWGETDVAFEYLSLHDASIERVDVDAMRVTFRIDFVRLGSAHPVNVLGETAIASGISLQLDDVVACAGRRFDDASHAWFDLEAPLGIVAGTRLVECNRYRRDDGFSVYEFEGFHVRLLATVEWTVTARHFVVRWNSPVRKWRA
jgi:hypothetical protein